MDSGDEDELVVSAGMSGNRREDKLQKLSAAELCLLNPRTFLKVLATKSTGTDYAKMILHIAQHATQGFGKTRFGSTSISSSNPISSNYISWAGNFADDDLEESALPALFTFVARIYSARNYIEHFPMIDLLGKKRSIKAKFNRSVKGPEELQICLDHQKAYYHKKAVKAAKIVEVNSRSRLRQIKSCVEATKTCLEVLQFQVSEQRPDAKRLRLDSASTNPRNPQDKQEAKKELIKTLKEQNKRGREILAELIVELVKRREVSSKLQTFMFDVVKTDDTEVDATRLGPRDLEFLVLDTQILRSKSVNGEIILQLNDLCD